MYYKGMICHPLIADMIINKQEDGAIYQHGEIVNVSAQYAYKVYDGKSIIRVTMHPGSKFGGILLCVSDECITGIHDNKPSFNRILT